MSHRPPLFGIAIACLPPLVAACGIPLGEIRSAAESGDVERAVRLARGELEGFRAAAEGTVARLAAEEAARPALREALELAPASAGALLEAWAAEESAVDPASRTFARARLSELEGGAWEAELRAALDATGPLVRAYAVRGLAAAGLSAGELLEALADPAPEVTREAAAGLAALARGDEGLPATVRPALREAFLAAADGPTRARLAGTLDPDDPDDLQALVAALGAGSAGVRLAAAAALGGSSAPAAVPELGELLEGVLRPAGLTLAQSLGRHGRTDLRDAYYERVLRDTPRDDPLRVGVLLGLEAGPASDGLLREAVAGGGPLERVAACERLLGAEDDAGCRGRLRELAAAATPFDAALAATEVLFEDGDPPAAAWLRSYVVQAAPALRRRVMAVAAARRFDDGLISLGLADPDPSVAAAAAVAALRVPDPLARPGVAP
ncbi:MAG: hypothetical protein JXB32_15560 [Deltaproteobacteria bacterium]|nr:hypothetical protein [Deltaproteobacteria bacterium]